MIIFIEVRVESSQNVHNNPLVHIIIMVVEHVREIVNRRVVGSTVGNIVGSSVYL